MNVGKPKSNQMEITVRRNENGEPVFKYPNDWNGDKVFLEICELCCRLSEELQELKKEELK